MASGPTLEWVKPGLYKKCSSASHEQHFSIVLPPILPPGSHLELLSKLPLMDSYGSSQKASPEVLLMNVLKTATKK